MATREISVPLGVREFLPHWVEETVLGDARGARAQYRHGNLHIRMYEDRYEVHTDRADPRRDPLGHLFLDALAAPALEYAARRAAGGGRAEC